MFNKDINLLHDGLNDISCSTHILIAILNGNPSHDETTTDEKYQLTFVIDTGRVFRNGANVELINFVKQTTLFPLHTFLLTKY